jgi:hypothetical protein
MISDLSGRIISLQRYNKLEDNKQFEINMTGRARGTYLVQLQGENSKRITGKVVID